jgi:hypothetical protein
MVRRSSADGRHPGAHPCGGGLDGAVDVPREDLKRTFDGAVDAYDSVRPTYPGPLFDELFAGLPATPEILEVGPGTGQATRDLIGRGASVHAISAVVVRRWDWDQTYRARDYRTLMESYSGTRTMAVEDRLGLLDAIEALVLDDFGGVVTRPLVVTLTTARLR